LFCDISNSYVADTGNHSIRCISRSGIVTTIAGSFGAGFADGSTHTSRFRYPRSVCMDHLGGLMIADSGMYHQHIITHWHMYAT
jgi:hypothetical protein